ncbi:Transducin (beta)-like 1 X-linked receptor 1, partial [Mortierella sp. GBA30]
VKNGLSFSHKRTWYAALRGADTLIQNGELTKFKTLVCEAPCRRDLAFQWGVCQRLGHLAADPVSDDVSRKDAIAFLGEMYWNDEEWGQEPRIKQCVLDILLQLSHSTSQDQVQSKPSVEPALRKYRRHRIQEQEQCHAVYIPPQAKPTRESPDDDLFDLTDRVNEFLQAVDSKVLLLLGDSGAGKSTFNLELERNLWMAYNFDKKWIPFFVTLSAIDMPEEDLIAKHLRKYEFTESQIRELKSYRQIVLICDGYDECKKKDNLYNDNRLNQPGEWNVKMVISCRSEYLGSDYRVFFQPGGRNDRKGATQLQEAVVAPFSLAKINSYIKCYVTKYQIRGENVWTAEDYQSAIKRVPNLQDLVKNPFLLSSALEVLPRLVDLSKDLTSNQISRLTLYDQFVEQWVERGQIRMIERSLTGDDHVAFEILSEDGFTRNAIGFVKSLAVAIFDEQDGKPVVEYSPIRDKSSWKDAFFGHGDGKNLLRETCPLSRIGNKYRFIHRSVLEYALARAAFEPGQLGADDQDSVEQPDVQYGDNRDAPSKNSSSSSPLFGKSFVNEHSIVSFLSERVLQSVHFRNQLLRFIDRSKSDERFTHAATNAITILVQAGVSFNGADLTGIRVPGADLSGGQFDSAQLQGADLRNTNLRNIWLRQADLSDAQMAGVHFDEWPYLEEEDNMGRHLLLASNGIIGLYNAATWDKTHILSGHTKDIEGVAFSPCGQRIASGSADYMVRLWDAQTGALAAILSGHTNVVWSVVFSPSGQQIASGSCDNTVRLWDAQTGAPGAILSGHTREVVSVVFSPNGQQIASGSFDSTVRLWDTQTGLPGAILSGHNHRVGSVAFSPRGQQIASASFDGTEVTSVAFSPSGQQIASGSSDSTVRLWDAQTGAPGAILSGHTMEVTSVVFSPSGEQIASGSRDNTVRLWDAQTGAPGAILSGHTREVMSVVFSPSGHQIASGSADNMVRLWDAQTGAPAAILSGHTNVVCSVVFSPSGHQIASSSCDCTVRLWEAKTGAPGVILSGHNRDVMSVVFLPSGHQIASCSSDSTVRVWNVKSGRCLAIAKVSHVFVLSMAWPGTRVSAVVS